MKGVQYLADQIFEWAQSAFPNQTEKGLANHLVKESKELVDGIYVGDYEEELADCFMLVLELSKKFGMTIDQLCFLTFEKLQKNKLRKWKEPDQDGVIEHVEEGI
jgi:NTP pyrophosphatase (non-canonical NTP hydrolase)